jgi:hypothetical protein
MTTFHLPTRTLRTLAVLSLAACMSLLTLGVASVAAASSGSSYARVLATASRAVPRSLAVAARHSTSADRTLVADAKRLKRCLTDHSSRPSACAATRRSLQRAGSNLREAELKLSRVARDSAGTTSGVSAKSAYWNGAGNASLQAPKITVSGQSLSWNKVNGVNSYVFVRKVPGQADQYSAVTGTSTTPPPVPGVTVKYSVRTSVNGSAWATEVAVAYPAPVETKPTETPPVETPPAETPKTETVDTQAAPKLTVSGQTISWSEVGDVTTYVLATKAPGEEEKFTEVSGTSVTPAAVAGATVHYSLRTAVDGSAWSTEVAIAYPASPPPPPPAKEHETTPPVETSSGPFEMGVVMGSAELYELPWAVTLKAATARVEFAIDDPVSVLEPIVEGYAKDGIRPLLLASFNERVPSAAEAENVAKWAVAFGPGGTFWQGKGKGLPADTAVTDIEFGNETNNPYQFSPTLPNEWQNQPSYLQRAEEYARRLQAASIAVSATGAKVGLLGIADQGNGYTTWVGAMFKAVPNLWQYVAGWTIHPYGPEWHVNMDAMIADTAAHGAPSTIPIYVTEWGLNSDNGRCLVANMGWNPCMTYAEAATDLASTISGMRSRYGSRLRAVYLFQARDQKATGTSTEFEGYYGALQSNMAPKGAYTTEVESLLSTNP